MIATAIANNFFENDVVTIYRSTHDRDNPYTKINRDLLQNENLSFGCRGLISYLLSHKDGWKFYFCNIREHTKKMMGRDALRTLIHEAIEKGYMKMVQSTKSGGRSKIKHETTYQVSETPIFREDFHLPEIQFTGKRSSNKKQLFPKGKREQQTQKTKVSSPLTRPVVVPLIPKEEIPPEEEKLAIEAANQYVATETKKGNSVNFGAIRWQAIKQRWKPNKTKEDLKNEKNRENEENKNVSQKKKDSLSEYVNRIKEKFTLSTGITARENVAELKTPNGVMNIPYWDDNFDETIKYFVEKYLS